MAAATSDALSLCRKHIPLMAPWLSREGKELPLVKYFLLVLLFTMQPGFHSRQAPVGLEDRLKKEK